MSDAAERFRAIKELAGKALAQVPDGDFFRQIDAESNSLAHLVKHMAGNLRSRWTDFLSTDGEKPDRRRDQEFEIGESDTREALMAAWEDGWRRLFAALEALSPEDLDRTVTVRAEPHAIEQAVSRQIAHQSHHAGQIVFLARHLRGKGWQTLSIPRGESEKFNEKLAQRVREP